MNSTDYNILKYFLYMFFICIYAFPIHTPIYFAFIYTNGIDVS